jgi:pseudouridine synthase
MAIEVIEWKDDSGREMVWRFSGGGELKLGAQLVVSENQWAVFFRDGKALDTFSAGRHTLTTANVPLLSRLIGLPFGGTSPFRADVYYVAKKVFTGMKWGTREPVVFRDAELSMVRLRANGNFAARVTDPQAGPDKTYHVQIDRVPEAGLLGRVQRGAVLDGESLGAKSVQCLRAGAKHAWLEIVLSEGRNRHIRRLLEHFGVSVLRLVRVKVGGLSLGELPKEHWRMLTAHEIAALSS